MAIWLPAPPSIAIIGPRVEKFLVKYEFIYRDKIEANIFSPKNLFEINIEWDMFVWVTRIGDYNKSSAVRGMDTDDHAELSPKLTRKG